MPLTINFKKCRKIHDNYNIYLTSQANEIAYYRLKRSKIPQYHLFQQWWPVIGRVLDNKLVHSAPGLGLKTISRESIPEEISTKNPKFAALMICLYIFILFSIYLVTAVVNNSVMANLYKSINIQHLIGFANKQQILSYSLAFILLMLISITRQNLYVLSNELQKLFFARHHTYYYISIRKLQFYVAYEILFLFMSGQMKREDMLNDGSHQRKELIYRNNVHKQPKCKKPQQKQMKKNGQKSISKLSTSTQQSKTCHLKNKNNLEYKHLSFV